ncbi:MAG: hypothetical protein Q8934_20830 [Bacillota bacterium]|nr:hypothetical protein [Bacillota bacterium]
MDKKIVTLGFDEEWLEGMEIQNIIISPVNDKYGVMVLTENFYLGSSDIVARILP